MGTLLALPPGAADGVMMAYGLRNLPSAAAGLRVIRHLLRPHGRAVVLDFNRPCHPLWTHGPAGVGPDGRTVLNRLAPDGLQEQVQFGPAHPDQVPGPLGAATGR